MSRTVDEVMNREVFGVPRSQRCEWAAQHMLGIGVGCAPVLDEARRPVGMVSLRDVFGAPEGALVRDRMSRPVIVVTTGTTVADAARRIGERGVHHAPVVDTQGQAIGLLSAFDLMRALVGLPTSHPDSFLHLDPLTGEVWSDDAPLDAEHVEAAPSVPGVVALAHAIAGGATQVVWAAATHDVQTRLLDLLGGGLCELPQLARWNDDGLRFRYALVRDERRRREVASRSMVAALTSARAQQLPR